MQFRASRETPGNRGSVIRDIDLPPAEYVKREQEKRSDEDCGCPDDRAPRGNFADKGDFFILPAGVDIFRIEIYENSAQDAERDEEVEAVSVEESSQEQEDQEKIRLVFRAVSGWYRAIQRFY